MPLPWKKTKGNRISRIVADLQPPPRTASLVVETGFPTSVIDLFVKNRERIKRQSSKKKKPTKHSDSVAPPPTPLLSPDNSLLSASVQPQATVVNANFSAVAGGGEIIPDFREDARVEEFGGGGASPSANANANTNTNGVVVMAVKMFAVVVLALSTKRLVVGITLSAFFLFFLEFFGKFVVGFFKPCFDEPAGMSPERKTHQVMNQSDGIVERRQESTTRDEPLAYESVDGERKSTSSGEIQMVEPNSTAAETQQHPGPDNQLGYLSREKRWGCSMEEEGKIRGTKNQKSKGAKLKAKIMKKLIPKKLRSGRKQKVKNKTEFCSEAAGNQTGSEIGLGEEEEEEEDERENEEESMKSVEEEMEEEDSDGVAEERENCECAAEKGKMVEVRSKIESVLVGVMILGGLLGGRIVAVVVTVAGCFMFKSIKILNQSRK